MLLEIHAHSEEHSRCSLIPAADILRQALGRNLQGVVLTDHHYRWSEEELDALRRSSGIPGHFLLLSGQEVSTPDLGHVLVFAAAPAIDEGTTAAAIRARFPEAALVRAHPYRRRLEYRESELPGPAVDAVEIFSSNHTMKANSRGLEDWHRYRFTATAGTDAHGQVPVGTYPTQFDHPVTSIEELAREIRRGRCRPFFKEITLAGAHQLVTEIVIGTKGGSEQRPRIILRRFGRQSDWLEALRTASLADELAARGFDSGRFRVPQVLEQDAGRMTIIEEGVRGKTLFERLRTAGPAEGRLALGLAAHWLARLHDLRPALTTRSAFLERESARLEGYARRFAAVAHRGAPLVRELAGAVMREEQRIVGRHPRALVQCHGDFHPKNLVLGQDSLEDRETAFIAALDLGNAVLAPPAFDVGWFLAHYRHQFQEDDRVLALWPPGLFAEEYRHAAGDRGGGFDREVAFFEARAGLSIASYLVKLGLGESETVRRLLSGAAEVVLGRPAEAGDGSIPEQRSEGERQRAGRSSDP